MPIVFRVMDLLHVGEDIIFLFLFYPFLTAEINARFGIITQHTINHITLYVTGWNC